jgi:FkbM family methyltransferase
MEIQRVDPKSDSYSALMWDVVCNAHRYTPRHGDRVLDFGAHYGLFSLFCAARGCHVKAYEPTPDTFTELIHSAAVASDIGLGSIEPIRAAVWSDSGIKSLWLCPETSGSNSFMRGKYEGTFETIQTVSLKQALDGLIWDCVKMDIEGAEHEVLTKAGTDDLELIRFLTVEIHNDILSFEQRAEVAQVLKQSFPVVDRLPFKIKGEPTDVAVAYFCRRP